MPPMCQSICGGEWQNSDYLTASGQVRLAPIVSRRTPVGHFGFVALPWYNGRDSHYNR